MFCRRVDRPGLCLRFPIDRSARANVREVEKGFPAAVFVDSFTVMMLSTEAHRGLILAANPIYSNFLLDSLFLPVVTFRNYSSVYWGFLVLPNKQVKA